MDLWALSDLSTPWCVHVAATLRIADHLAAGHTKIDELAAAAGSDSDSLSRMLRHLVSQGVFTEPEPGRFEMNDSARPLLDPQFRLGLNLDGIGGRMAHAWGTLLAAVRTGNCSYAEVFGRDYWSDLEAHPEVEADFDALMGPAGHGAPDPNVLGEPAEWTSIKTVVDVGGGTGALLAEILKAHPSIRGVLVDRPPTVARSAELFEAAGVVDRVTTSPQSFFDPLPAGGDLYLLSKVLCDWPDSEAIAILRRCAEAASPSGRVIVLHGAGPEEEVSPELLMMVLVGGRGRALSDLSSLARTAGLEVSRTHRQHSGHLIVEFRPVPPSTP